MISKTGIHAVTAMVVLEPPPDGEYIGASDIADQIGAPRNYLGKLLKTFADDGLVESRRGKGGGFRLARDPAAISLFEVLEPIEHLNRWSNCFLGRECCADENPCAVHQRWKIVRETYLRFLRETSVADIAQRPVGSCAWT